MIKVNNPVENNPQVEQMEELVTRYYDLVSKSQDIRQTESYSKFAEIDLEQLLNEGANLQELDLSDILK